MIFELNEKIVYARGAESGKERSCTALEFRKARGIEVDDVFRLCRKLESGDEKISVGQDLVDFAGKFAKVVGDEDSSGEAVVSQLESKNMLRLASWVVENFT